PEPGRGAGVRGGDDHHRGAGAHGGGKVGGAGARRRLRRRRAPHEDHRHSSRVARGMGVVRAAPVTTGAPGHRPAAHLVLPATVDDPRTPSGGNTYDRRVRDGLVDAGWDVTVSVVPWDRPPPAAAFDALDRALAA